MIFLNPIQFIYAFLSFHSILTIHAIVYELYGSNGTISCADATIDDTCILHCDKDTEPQSQFDCGDAGHCYFYCDEDKCLQQGTLNATNSTHLYTHTSADECFLSADVLTAEYSYFTSNTVSDKAFKRIQIHGSTNTEYIYVNCTSSESESCRELYVDANSTSMLHIVGSESAILESATVHCPRNSNYIGPHAAPCIIDFSEGGEIKGGQFYTSKGTPQDIMIYGELSGAVMVHCSAGLSRNDGNSFVGSGDCYITLSPTQNPTTTPTHHPTPFPTVNPSRNPSLYPTKSPTSFPTFFPTLLPSNVPTSAPSNIPTYTPTLTPTYVTDHPTFIPTNVPSLIPTNMPTFTPTNVHTLTPTLRPTILALSTTAGITASDGPEERVDLLAAVDIKVVMIIILLLVVCVMCIFICTKKLILQPKRERTASTSHVDVEAPTHWSANRLPRAMHQKPQLTSNSHHSNSISSSLRNVAHKLEGLAHGINPDFARNLRDTNNDAMSGSIPLHVVHKILSNDDAASTMTLTVPKTGHVGETSIEFDALSECGLETNAKGLPKHDKRGTNLGLEGVNGTINGFKSKGMDAVHVDFVEERIMDMMNNANSQIWHRKQKHIQSNKETPKHHDKKHTNVGFEGANGKMVDGGSRLNILDEDCEDDGYEPKGNMNNANAHPEPKQIESLPHNTKRSSNVALPSVTPQQHHRLYKAKDEDDNLNAYHKTRLDNDAHSVVLPMASPSITGK